MTTDRKELSRAEFDKDAEEYDESPKYASLRLSYQKIADEALRNEFRTWLDIGCGTGALLLLIGQQKKDAQLFGVDLSEQMIKVARSKLGKTVDLRVSDSEKLPFEDNQFDLITCTFSFHHYPKPKTALAEMQRVLSPNGRVIIADASAFFPINQIHNLLAPLRKDGTIRVYSRAGMQKLAQSVGLVVSSWSKLNWHSHMLVFERKRHQ
jgi:ubiquinone/menaquinone biosynthesis C-methylase UbiE